jgi:hypothetical protein
MFGLFLFSNEILKDTKSEFGAFKLVSVSVLSFDNSFETGLKLVTIWYCKNK